MSEYTDKAVNALRAKRIDEAQVWATLEHAQQQRIANFIAIGVDATTRGEAWGAELLYKAGRVREGKELYKTLTLRPEIAALLDLNLTPTEE